ncbi:MAG: cellulase family glycosylhydrolase [Oscillospiraceae bacterium]|nr:cellulase family glycosylhydrolase [Oscillospiraceae bacterium]
MKHNYLGRLVSAAASAVLLTSGISALPQNAFAADAALSGLTARQITDQMVIGWNLGNTLDSHNASYTIDMAPAKFATCWGNPEPTKELFETIKAAGFNTVRIPTTWYQHVEFDEAQSMYVIDERWMDYVKQTVDYAYELDMFIILNVHHEETWVNVSEFTDATYAVASAMLGDIWTQVSDEFAEYDQHLIFEGMNEPRQKGLGSSVEWGTGDSYSRQYINNLNAVFVNTVRSQGSSQNKERLLMLPGYCASSGADAVRNIAIPEGSGNVALSVHAYAPYFFTMATDSYANHEFPGKSGYGEDYEGHLTNLFNSLKSISDEKGAPIIIGEFGASDFNNTESRVNWAKSYLSKAKAAGIPCVLWDNNAPNNGSGEAHGYLYRLTNTWYPNSAPVIEAMMGVYGVSCTLPEYEEYVKPPFSWDDVPMDDSWIEIYKPNGGQTLQAWKNASVSSIRDYVSEDYDIALVYESSAEPYLVMQGGWYQVYSSSSDNTTNVMYFSYDDFKKVLDANGETLDTITRFYISAAAEEMTIQGLFAIPKEKAAIKGDINGDGSVTVMDVVILQKYLLAMGTLTEAEAAASELTEDGKINGFDLAVLKRLVLAQ